MSPFFHPGDPTCTGCGGPLSPEDVVCDLGLMPLANALRTHADLARPETYYPLRPLICRNCLLMQLPDPPNASLVFKGDYPFYAGQSQGWVAHCADFADEVINRYGIGPDSHVLEIGSNDGTMLRAFMQRQGDPHLLGVEPCREVATHALREGFPTDIAAWTEAYAKGLVECDGDHGVDEYRADLVIATNVLAHVRDLGDFLRGVRRVLAPNGVAIFEVPYVGNLITECQFDQIYAEHHCYFGVQSLTTALSLAGLEARDIEFIPTHGGSIQVHATRDDSTRVIKGLIQSALEDEIAQGYADIRTYLNFIRRPAGLKISLLRNLTACPGSTWGYGASAKAVTLCNYCGIGPELIEAVADTTPTKRGKYMPGCRIPIVSEQALAERQPNYVVNFLWNWADESEARIRALCPNARIIYPNVAAIARLEEAT